MASSQTAKTKAGLTLIADIGGTNARFAVIRPGIAEAELLPPVLVADYPTPGAAIAEVVHRRAGLRPRSAVLAVAAPIAGERMKLTNGPWWIEPRSMMAELGLAELILVNDFEAQALALPRLDAHSLAPIGGGRIEPRATKLVVGPGTGLGAAGLIQAGGWRPIGGEGGHVERAPITERERALWPHIERDGERVDAEQILSGAGLLRLYRAITATDGIPAALSGPAAIVDAGLAGDPPAREALELFAVHLGRYAGDMALVFMARGGVYIAGGIALRLAGFLQQSGFRAAFDDKPPYRPLMAEIAVSVVTHPQAGLLGLAGMVQSPEDYAVPIEGRHWVD